MASAGAREGHSDPGETGNVGDEATLGHPPGPWLILGVAIALYVGFGIVVASIAPLISPISRDLQVTPAQMGAVLGAWQLVYIGTAYLVGLALDRVGMRRTLAAGSLLIAASAALRGLAVDFPTLLGAVALFGVGGPAISIGVPKLVAALFGERDRATALGMGTAAPFFGMMFAFGASNSVLLPLMGDWRGVMFLYAGFVAVLVVVWWWVAPRDAPIRVSRSAADGPDEHAGGFKLLRIRNVALALVAAPLLFAIGHGVNNWLVRILEGHQLAPNEAGYWAAIANGLTAVGVLFIPRLVPAGRRRFALAVVLTGLGASVLGLGVFDGPPLWLTIVVYGLCRIVPTTLIFLILIDTPGVGGRHIGAVAGAFFATAEIGGFGGPFLVGALLEWTDSFIPSLALLCALGLGLALMTRFLREGGVSQP